MCSSCMATSSVVKLHHIKPVGCVHAAAMNQLTKNLCCEWGPDGIHVNAVSPWYILTPLAQQVLQDDEYKAKVLSRTPLKRVGQPHEVSGEQS